MYVCMYVCMYVYTVYVSINDVLLHQKLCLVCIFNGAPKEYECFGITVLLSTILEDDILNGLALPR